MMLSDVRDYIDSLKIADHVYMGKLPDKQERAVGVYNSRHSQAYRTAIGGPDSSSYGLKPVTFLIHWNKSPRDTEKAAAVLFEAIQRVREEKINHEIIKFIQPLYDLQDVGTDDAGVYEMVIEAAVVYQKKKGDGS